MLTNAQATLYNRYVDPATKKERWLRTALLPVRWEDNRARNVLRSGLANANGVDIIIWRTVASEGKVYVEPKQFATLPPEEVEKYWTLTPATDRMVRGIVPDEPVQISELVTKYDSVITIKSVDTVDYGRPHMHKWEVSGS